MLRRPVERNKYDEDYNLVVDKLFNSFWLCESTKICLSLIQDNLCDVSDIEDKYPAVGSFKTATGVTRVESNSNQEGIVDMLNGVSRMAVGAEYQTYVGIMPIERANLSTANIADLIYKEGTVTLLFPENAVDIYTDIGAYMTGIARKKLMDIDYEPPSEEEVNAFQNLYNIIELLADYYINQGYGESAIHVLRRLSNKTTVGNIINTRTQLTLNGKSQSGYYNEPTNYRY